MKEIRNTYSHRMLSSLVQQSTFRVASECHLQVGHTHEDVDAVFSLCTAALRSCPILETPRDIQRRLLEKLGPVWERKGMVFDIELVGEVAWFQFLKGQSSKDENTLHTLAPSFILSRFGNGLRFYPTM